MDPVITALIDSWNTRDLDRAEALYAPDFVGEDIGQAEPQQGPADARLAMEYYFSAFPDIQIRLDEVVREGERVVLFWTAIGTHKGVFMNIPPTGRHVEVQGVSRMKLRDGFIVRAFYMWDYAGLLRSLRLLPDL